MFDGKTINNNVNKWKALLLNSLHVCHGQNIVYIYMGYGHPTIITDSLQLVYDIMGM